MHNALPSPSVVYEVSTYDGDRSVGKTDSDLGQVVECGEGRYLEALAVSVPFRRVRRVQRDRIMMNTLSVGGNSQEIVSGHYLCSACSNMSVIPSFSRAYPEPRPSRPVRCSNLPINSTPHHHFLSSATFLGHNNTHFGTPGRNATRNAYRYGD